MIIVDAGPQPPVNKHSARAGYESSGLPQSPPPPPPYNPQLSRQVPVYYPVPAVYRPTQTAPRFWKAFGIAVLIWCLFVAYSHSFVEMVLHGSRPTQIGDPPYPDRHDGIVHQCITGSNWTSSNVGLNSLSYSADVFLELPADSDAIYLFTRGSQQSGHVNVVQSTTATNKVGVRVRVSYQAPETLRRISVCRLERKTNEHGIGILTPGFMRLPFPGTGQQLRFEVDIVLPAGKNGDALHIKSFETETSNYSQDIADIWDTVSFDRISLKTSNAHVIAKSITAEESVIHSSNGAIEGHFNSGSSIKLTTSNGAIRASVSLLNRENGTPSELKMTTSNGNIDANVDLITHSGQGGIFDVGTRSSNGAVSLEYASMPVDAVLKSETRSSNAAASVKLHGAFEGSFEATTSNGKAVFRELPAEDPSGQGRRRVVTQTGKKTHLEGSAYWEEGSKGASEGWVTVATSNGRVELLI